MITQEEYGDREHTFGEVCGDSDKDVLENEYESKRYVESGKVKGKMLHLEVNKSVVKVDGEIIGVVGSGRDITEYREELIENAQIAVAFFLLPYQTSTIALSISFCNVR